LTALPPRATSPTVPIIAIITDFGLQDWYVGSMKGALLSRCRHAQMVDVTHDVPRHDIMAGALALAATVPWFPRQTVFLAVVDPGVGGRRALLAAEADGRYLVGPDNGLLALALSRASRTRIVRLRRARATGGAVSRTFHGRDLLAPVAAALANGAALSRFGMPVRRFTPLAWPAVERRAGRVRGRVVHLDGFGNVITNLPGRLLASPGVRVRYRRRMLRVVPSYASGRVGEPVALVNSLNAVELALRHDSAARRLRVKRGDIVEVVGAR